MEEKLWISTKPETNWIERTSTKETYLHSEIISEMFGAEDIHVKYWMGFSRFYQSYRQNAKVNGSKDCMPSMIPAIFSQKSLTSIRIAVWLGSSQFSSTVYFKPWTWMISFEVRLKRDITCYMVQVNHQYSCKVKSSSCSIMSDSNLDQPFNRNGSAKPGLKTFGFKWARELQCLCPSHWTHFVFWSISEAW